VKLSVVIPVRDERENIVPLLDEIDRVLRAAGKSFEVIAVDDGSRDGSGELLRRLTGERPYLKALVFRRNHGQSAALDAGFRHASGQVVVTMDGDRQNDPADIPAMLARLQAGNDVVTGWRRNRSEGFLRWLPSRLANWLVRLITGTRVHDLGCSLRIYRREITDELRLYGEMHRFIAVLAEDLGARVEEMVVNHRPRGAGRSKYGLLRTFKLLPDLCTVWFLRRFQTKPIYIFGGLGLLLFLAGVVLCGWVLWQKLGQGVWVHRNPLFIIAVTCFLMAMQLIGSGLLAEMVVRTYFESQGKPSYSIAAKLGFDPAPPPPPGGRERGA
jgi:glycosyltransferase involved in cell wall biosynthesis